jgi:hypothetical protein
MDPATDTFNDRFSAASETTMSPSTESFLYRTTMHAADRMRIDPSFPSQGTPQPSHQGSQSTTPNKDLP